MGLLDSLFDPSAYGGDGGLLSRLLPMTGAIPQSQGFPDQGPTFAQRFQPAIDNPLAQPASFAQRFQAAADNPLVPMAGNINVGGYSMPRIGNPTDYASAPDAAIPPNAQPTQGQIPPQMQQPAQATAPSFLQPPTQGGLGGAFRGLAANAQAGPLGMLIGAIGGAAGMGRGNPQDIAQQNMRAQYESTRQALLANGVPEQQANSTAMLSVLNPEAAKTVLPELLTNKEKYGVISENPIEGKKYGFINERDQTINGRPIGSGTGASAGTTLLAPGVQYNPNLTGNDYLGQFSPEVQAAVKAYINGDVLPSGNPRQQGIASQAKTIAQKYGADMGIPVSDALYAEKRKYRTELGSNSANSAGGQAKAFNQGISHLSDLADKLEKLDNSNGFGIPAVAGVVNSARQGISNEQSAIADEAKSIGQTVAGEVGKLFSGSAGGGVHEREITRDRFDTVKSKPQLAAALRATIETMQGGLAALEQNRDRILGPNSGVDFVGEDTRAKIAKIQGVIDRLEGKVPAQSAAPALPSGWSVKVH